jgi:phosphate transport system permease protein
MSVHSLTGRARRRETRPSVRVAERVARVLISIGGIGTILAVTLILVFLLWVVLPLFRGAEFQSASATAAPRDAQSGELFAVGVDEYQVMAWGLMPAGSLIVWRTDTGDTLETRELFPGAEPTAYSNLQGEELAVGFRDGSVRVVRLGFEPRFVEPTEAPDLVALLGSSVLASNGASLVQRTPKGQLRVQTFEAEIGAPIELGSSAPIMLVDRSSSGGKSIVAALDSSGNLVVAEIEKRENMMTGEVTTRAQQHSVKWRTRATPPAHLLVSGTGSVLYLAWQDGTLQRYDARDKSAIELAEELDLVEGDATLDRLAFVIGKTTLLSGDSAGRVRGWFGIKPEVPGTRDGVELVRAHELASRGSPVTALSPSERSRVIVAGFADGSVEMLHVTSHKRLFETRIDGGQTIAALAIAPKENGVLAATRDRVASWHMDLGHPEASLGALFTPVWYEGYETPEHAWRATGGTDDVEPKFGLMPLIFGTIKATLYSMLFGVPLAILAAIFTAEFLDPRLRAPLKSLTELMASLPSVVLGFLAAIVIAPFAQSVVPIILTALFTIPGALLLGGHLWQMLPPRAYVQLSGRWRFGAIIFALPFGVLAAVALGPLVERVLFAGDIQLWLDRQRGTGIGGWMLLLFPLAAIAVTAISARVVSPWQRRISAGWTRAKSAQLDLAKFGVQALLTLILAALVSWMLDGVGFDPRGGVLDTYMQRNALVVGFVMGFAIIPIIYTLAEDALSSVPGHLRLASLGAGATPWQTAVRVVIPTAMSGLFSAVMIGLGRAVGETMIVLMATGGTPIMSWNVFDGFRTLSANIATEMPEAVRNSTHYRTLFLAALCLFALTFALNTVAEVVRQRFRKRAYQL